jgi:glycosyltransferase involved in cell wall biosynthesis
MKLIVFTPANTKSAIARMAALVTRELVAQGCEVTVVRTEAKHLLSTDLHDFGVRVLSWDNEAEVRVLILGSDACIYQIGNNFEYHEGGVRWLADFPGVVCLHDFFLGHLFYGWAENHRAQAYGVLQSWYGEESAVRFFSFSDNESFIGGTLEDMPMTEWICSQADGVITHSSWGCDRVLNSCAGPVRVVPLAYDAPAALANTVINTSADRTLQILTIGHVNPNKRVASVIQAIGISPLLRNRVNYRLVGAVEPEMMSSLSALAARLGVNLVISGEVDDDELKHAITESDVISCLRWPALEAASASAIEAMLYGKSVIVTDTGFYADIPDSCVVKINPSNEIPDIQYFLEVLLEDRSRVKNLGENARNWAAQTFTSKNYAMQLIEVIEITSRTAAVKRAVDFYRVILSRWSSNGASLVTTDLVKPLSIFENID